MPEARLATRLLSSTGVTSIVGRLVRPVMESQGSTGPHVTYQRISTTPSNHSTGTGNLEFCRVQVDCYAETYRRTKELAKAVKTSLSGWSSSTGSPRVSMCHHDGEQDLPEEVEPGQSVRGHRVSHDFLLQVST